MANSGDPDQMLCSAASDLGLTVCKGPAVPIFKVITGILSCHTCTKTKNICCWYSLEVPLRGASNEYPQCIFSWRCKKNISPFRLKKVPYLEL